MPNYGYRCQSCQREFEMLQRMIDPPLAACPDCGGTGTRLFYPTGILFKGSGFYKNDSRSAAPAPAGATADTAAPSPDGGPGSPKPAKPATESPSPSPSPPTSTPTRAVPASGDSPSTPASTKE